MRGLRRPAAAGGLLVLLAALVYAGAQLWQTSVPDGLRLGEVEAARAFPPGALERAESYATVARLLEILSLVALVVVLVLYARRGARLARHSAAGPIGTGFLLGMLGLALVWLAQLPFGLVALWWAKDHDVVRTGWLDAVLGDWLALGGRFVFLCATLLVAMGLARLLRRTWWIPAAAVFSALALLFAFVAPWLSTLEKPRSERLRSDARELAARQGVPEVPLRIERVREATPAPNAYAFGLGPSRRVVLWDTITGFPPREVRITLAHEYAHQAHRHIPKQLGWFALLALPTGLLVALFTRSRGGLRAPEAVPVALLVVTVVQLATTPLTNAASRRYEAEADWAALNTTRDPAALAALFRHFSAAGLADPDPPGWYHAVFDGHPRGVERIAMARAWAARERAAAR